MKNLLLIIALFFCGPSADAAEMTYCVDRPTLELISSAKENLEQYEGGSVDLQQLGKLKNLDLQINTLALTRDRYYKFEVRLRSPVGKLWKFEKSLEVWGGDAQTTVRSRVDIGYGKTRKFPLRWVNRVKNRIISKVECIILNLERQKLRELTR